MKFEGEDTAITLRGIERAGKDTISKDGAMNEVIGLIARDESFIPYSPTDTGLNKANDIRMVRIHHTSTGDNIIIVRDTDAFTGEQNSVSLGYIDNATWKRNGYCLVKKTFVQTEVENVLKESDNNLYGDIEEIVFIGNRMILKTDSAIESYLWKQGKYIKETNITSELGGTNYVLPTINFKVRAGIYDGEKVHEFAQCVSISNPYTTGLSKDNANVIKEAEYVRTTNRNGVENKLGNEAFALMGEIENAGGITGYVLVAAAYHRKSGSTEEGESYIPATPIMLMGTPEIYQKDGVLSTNTGDVSLPTKQQYMPDVLGYQSIFTRNIGGPGDLAQNVRKRIQGIESQESSFAQLKGTTNDITIQYSDAADKDFVGNKQTVLRTATGYWATGSYTQSMTSKKEENMHIPSSSTMPIRCPMLIGCKYATYQHPGGNGSANNDKAKNIGYDIVRGTGNVLSFRINSDIAYQYKDEIDSLVIFMSPVISPFKTKETEGTKGIEMYSTYNNDISKDNGNTFRDAFFFDEKSANWNYKRVESACGGGFLPKMKSEKELRDEIEEITGLYQIHKVEFDDIKQGGWIDINLTDKLGDGLTNGTAMSLSSFLKASINNGHIFGYNERLHIYNYEKSTIQRIPYKTLSYYGKRNEGQYNSIDNRIYNYAIVVTDRNDSKIVSKFGSTSPIINPMISYPDTEAKKIQIIKYYQSGHRYFLGTKDFDISIKSLAGLSACYLDSKLSPINVPVKEVSLKEYNNAVSEEQIAKDSHEYSKNGIRVFETGSNISLNSKTYTIGKGEIIGLARFTMGLAQDNFGRFPLVVFTTDGIYTMEVDATGENAYTTQSPVSRMICTNKDSICELDGAVLFASEYGLMLLTDGGVKPIAHHVNGKPSNIPTDKNGLTMYKNAISHEKIVELTEDISSEDFVEYIQIKGTIIRYLHTINSVLIYNPDKTYSYILELKDFICTKIEQQIKLDDNDYPKQTFYIKPDEKTVISIETPMKDEDGNVIEGRYEIKVKDIIAAADSLDTTELLKEHFNEGIAEQLNTKAKNWNDERMRYESIVEDSEKSKEYIEKLADDDELFQYVSKEEMLQKLDEDIAYTSSLIPPILKDLDNIGYITNVFNGLEPPKEGDNIDDLLASVSIKSVNTRLKEEEDGKADYTELREQLRRERATQDYGYINEAIFSFPIGKTIWTKTDDKKWQRKRAKNELSEDMFSRFGLIPARDFAIGDRYVVNVTNKNYISVQFDYYTGKDDTPCLLQSRPIKLDTASLKSAYRVVVRGTFDKNNDISVNSEAENKFTIIDEDKLGKRLKQGEIVLYYKECDITGGTETFKRWQWVDKDGKSVTLKDMGIIQQNSIEKREDTLTLSIREHYAGLYVFGSLDGEHWMPIGGTEKLLSYNRFHDIGVRTHRVSVKYLMVVFAGCLSQDSHIDGLEITSETRYNNKLK